MVEERQICGEAKFRIEEIMSESILLAFLPKVEKPVVKAKAMKIIGEVKNILVVLKNLLGRRYDSWTMLELNQLNFTYEINIFTKETISPKWPIFRKLHKILKSSLNIDGHVGSRNLSNHKGEWLCLHEAHHFGGEGKGDHTTLQV